MLQAANYLNIKGLLDLTCLTVANMIKGAASRVYNVLPTHRKHSPTDWQLLPCRQDA